MDVIEAILLNPDPEKRQFDCIKHCTNEKCDGTSKKQYKFDNDLRFAELNERMIMELITSTMKDVKDCVKLSHKDNSGDLKIIKINGEIEHAEVKAQTRTFMKAMNFLGDETGIPFFPSETVAMNTSDFENYVDWQYNSGKRMTIYWCVYNRPCIVKKGQVAIFKADLNVLNNLYLRDINKYKKRQFKRESGSGDVNEYGEHLGVTGNLHFRLSELEYVCTMDTPEYIREYLREFRRF